ncbi:MAG: hypothetical protein C0507_08490 [Cyanobacteria bacterium PR.3.49]|nr:hypothetical protein [Cyanobacteria bacterium PR.3.49]
MRKRRKGRKSIIQDDLLLLLDLERNKFGEVVSPIQEQQVDDSLDKAIEKNIEFLVNSGEQVNNRRQTVMNFFWLVNGVIFTAQFGLFKFIIEKLPEYQQSKICAQGIAISICIGLIAFFALRLCDLWKELLDNYASVSGSKIDLMQALESCRAVRTFTTQYEIVAADKGKFLSAIEIEIADLILGAHKAIGAAAFALGAVEIILLATKVSH